MGCQAQEKYDSSALVSATNWMAHCHSNGQQPLDSNGMKLEGVCVHPKFCFVLQYKLNLSKNRYSELIISVSLQKGMFLPKKLIDKRCSLTNS